MLNMAVSVWVHYTMHEPAALPTFVCVCVCVCVQLGRSDLGSSIIMRILDHCACVGVCVYACQCT
jgi:hypothetical protein